MLHDIVVKCKYVGLTFELAAKRFNVNDISSRLWCQTVSLSPSHRYPGSGVVLNCVDS